MKNIKWILFTLGMCLLLSTPLFTQDAVELSSFRNQSTGGALVDDLDLVYDPVELSFVDSIRIYTNLSNLTSGQEEFMNGVSDNMFLFGISGALPMVENLNSALLFAYQNASLPGTVYLDGDRDGFTDVQGEGDLEDVFTQYQDTDGDGLFDVIENFRQVAHNNYGNNMFSAVLNNSYQSGDMVLGARLSLANSKMESSSLAYPLFETIWPLEGADVGDPSFEREGEAVYMNDGSQAESFSETGEFANSSELSLFDITLSAMIPVDMMWGKTEARADLSFSKIKSQDIINALYAGQIDVNDFNPNVVGSYWSDMGFFNYPYDGYSLDINESVDMSEIIETTDLGMGINLKRVFHKVDERRFHGYWRVGAAFHIISGDYNLNFENPFTVQESFPAYPSSYLGGQDSTFALGDLSYTMVEEDIGEVSSNILSLYGNTQIPLGDRVVFGMGAYFSTASTTRDAKYRFAGSMGESVEVLDDSLTVDDMTGTLTASESADHTYELAITRISVPVGLEYTFSKNKKWKIRFGALFNYLKEVENDAYQVTDFEPEVIQVENGEGDVIVETGDVEYHSVSSHTETIYTSTLYTYGLGYCPTPNLQVDLIGFFGNNFLSLLDSEFYRRLRLSITIRM
ncbi:hypothetical protein HQ585_18960 [candidate division KSB1 bacterium]|nr:hypothetical protein [candidate division KSB1 bacterium]